MLEVLDLSPKYDIFQSLNLEKNHLLSSSVFYVQTEGNTVLTDLPGVIK